ncbi:uncharacterized protein LOC142354283 [Convolutriloba macropyga]|uniref:uncharacterized protein LOC142354283 n=1 Tax=Convolutriloba macropyga TaxID=536237 RepID=UPI003F5216BC
MQFGLPFLLFLLKIVTAIGQGFVSDNQEAEGSGSGYLDPEDEEICGYGSIKQPGGGSCVKGAKVVAEMRFNMDFNDQLEVKDSEEFLRAKENFEKQLFKLYTQHLQHLIAVHVLDILRGSVIVRHEINQVIFSDDVGQATADLANSVKAIANDKEAMQHFQIESISVVPIKVSHKVKVVLDKVFGGAGMPDENALQTIRRILASLRPKGIFVSEPLYTTRDREKDTITVYGFLRLPENVNLADYQTDAKRSNLFFYEFDDLPVTTKQLFSNIRQATPPPQTSKPSSVGLMGNPAILAAIISGAVAAIFCLVLITVFIVCRMRKKNTGSVELETRVPPHLNGAGNDPRKMYLYNKPACREIYA